MSNMVMNILTVEGNKKYLNAFKDYVKNDEENLLIDFNKVIKCPEIYEKDGYWYDWRLNNWGTKWNPVDVNLIEETDYSLKYEFLTAWNPPEEIFHKLIKIFPHLRLHVIFAEEQFKGICGEYEFSRDNEDKYIAEYEDDYERYFDLTWGLDSLEI